MSPPWRWRQGWLSHPDVDQLESLNCDDRPADIAVSLIVIHAISLPPEQFHGNAVSDFFMNRLDCSAHPFFTQIHDLKVSAHFFIRRTGQVIQFVSVDKRAWHAGVSSWHGRERCNDFSVGIELEGSDSRPFTSKQYQCLVHLISAVRQHYPIRHIAGHCDIAPGRKTDPGPCFDWTCLRRLLGVMGDLLPNYDTKGIDINVADSSDFS